MAKKRKEKVKVHFIGNNATGVTGSMTLIIYKDKKILLECGLVQSNSKKEDFMRNKEKFPFKSNEIDYILVGHQHIDHIGKIPALFKQGCCAQIVTTHEALPFFEPLLRDSASIMQRDVELLSRQSGNSYKPIYEDEDVEKTLAHLRGYDYNVLYELDNMVSIRLIPSGHIIGSCQIELFIKQDDGHVTKILCTSDLGNTTYEQPFVRPFEKITKATYVIGECTYADNTRKVANKNARQKDIEKLKTVIDSTCIDRNSTVVIPVFSMQRTQVVLKMIYDLFAHDEDFHIPVIIDSPLACKMTELFRKNLPESDRVTMEEIMKWKNVRLIEDSDDSKACVSDSQPKVILSSSGMGTNGRIKYYLKKSLPKATDCVVFCGFATEGSLSWKIKNCQFQKTITIDSKAYKNKCQVVNLTSFSGHMQYDDLLNYYGQINTTKVFLVHGEQKHKVKFKNELQKIYEKQGKTTRVVAVNKGTTANL